MAVPVSAIANNRAAYYAKEFAGNFQRSLYEDTVPLFEGVHYAIKDWAENNMDWADVVDTARLVSDQTLDYQEGWINGDKRIVQREAEK